VTLIEVTLNPALFWLATFRTLARMSDFRLVKTDVKISLKSQDSQLLLQCDIRIKL
jgi:hypothetical protein